MVKLQLSLRDEVLKELETGKKEIFIGRDIENDLCVENIAVSSRHAKLFKSPDGKYVLEDLNSTNGTYVNGREVMTQALNDNDRITIGKYTIHVTYKSNDSIMQQQSSQSSESTYMFDPYEREKLTRKK